MSNSSPASIGLWLPHAPAASHEQDWNPNCTSKGAPQKGPCEPKESHGYARSGTQLRGENVDDAGDDGPEPELTEDVGDSIWWTMWFIDMSLGIDRGCGFWGIPG